MKKKNINGDSDLITRGMLREELDAKFDEKLKDYPTKKELDQIFDDKLRDYPTKVEMGIALENLRSAVRGDTEELLKQFRSDMFSRFDQLLGEQVQIREEQVFLNYENKQFKKTNRDHEERISTLEKESY